jgi:hypothetical protein
VIILYENIIYLYVIIQVKEKKGKVSSVNYCAAAGLSNSSGRKDLIHILRVLRRTAVMAAAAERKTMLCSMLGNNNKPLIILCTFFQQFGVGWRERPDRNSQDEHFIIFWLVLVLNQLCCYERCVLFFFVFVCVWVVHKEEELIAMEAAGAAASSLRTLS